MSYTLNYTGSEIDDILDRAAPGGALDTAIAAKQDALTFDAVPTEGSTNPAESGGIYDAIQAGGAAALAAFATDSVSGDVVSFPDGADGIPVKAFTGSILPQQNLNGQSAPYPAGGGKNKYSGPATVNKGTTQYESVTIDPLAPAVYTISAKVSTTAAGATKCRIALREADGTAITAVTIPVGTTRTSVTVDTTSYGKSVGRLYFYSTQDTSDTNTAVFEDVQIETGSSATDYAPYSNICPISGWTGANITRAGKNLYNDATTSVGSYINSSGVVGTSSGNVFSLSDYIPVTGDKVTITNPGGWGSNPAVCFFDKDKNFISGTHPTTSPVTLTIPSGAAYLRTSLSTQTRASAQVELGSTVSTYEAYQADTIALSFGQTVYGGALDVTNGVLTVNYKMLEAQNITWTQYTGAVGFTDAEIVANKATTIFCSHYHSKNTVSGWTELSDGDICKALSTNVIRIKDTAHNTDLAAWNSYITAQKTANTPVQILISLNTPVTIQLTPTEVQTLLGANTVWTDCGSVTGMTYRADTALYIQKLLNGGGTLQTLSMASPSPSLSLGRVGVLAEQEEAEPEQTDEEAEQLEQTEEPEQAEEA